MSIIDKYIAETMMAIRKLTIVIIKGLVKYNGVSEIFLKLGQFIGTVPDLQTKASFT